MLKYLVPAALVMSTMLAPPVLPLPSPSWISYQGYLTDNAGVPLDSTYILVFRIYVDTLTSTHLWLEEDTVAIDNGKFSLYLGRNNPLVAGLFGDTSRWLGITIIPFAGELKPRTRLVTSPYAHHVSTVDGASGGTIKGSVTIEGVLETEELLVVDPEDTTIWIRVRPDGVHFPLDTLVYSIPSAGGWVPQDDTIHYFIGPDGILTTDWGPWDSVAYYAEVHLPDEAHVFKLEAYVYDNNSDDNAHFTFFYRTGTILSGIATASTSGASSAYGNVSVNLSHTVNYDGTGAYGLRALVPGAGGVSFGNVRVWYTLTQYPR